LGEESETDPLVLAEAHSALARQIADRGVSAQEIAAFFDGLSAGLRLGLVRRLGRREQRDLYRKVEGFAAVGLTDLVSARRADLEEVRHLGWNTLPLFRAFEKRFCRVPGQDPSRPEELAGYNFQTMAPLTGPGYFVAVEDPARGEVVVDYRRLPESKPADWPEVRSNEVGLGRFVYGFMVDRLRRVSEHVTVGSAARNDRELGSYFTLARDDG
jgi:hypothetical protein